MRLLLISISFYVVSLAQAEAQSLKMWENLNEPIELGISYFNEEVCWKTNAPECDIEGFELSVKIPLEHFYVNFSLGGFQSDDFTGDDGEPYLQTVTASIGVGKDFDLTDAVSVFGEINWLVESDDNNGNTNFNDGPEIRGGVNWAISNTLSLGVELALQNDQNCSHPECHGLHDDKERIVNTAGKLFATKKISEQWDLRFGFFRVIEVKDKDLYNGRDLGSPGAFVEGVYYWVPRR